MTSTSPASLPLTEDQRARVRENIGLVGVHLRRVVSPRARCTNTRNRDDLFQEGCLGLIRAARTYDPRCGIPFPAFALPRIRGAVHEALIIDGERPRRPRRGNHDPTKGVDAQPNRPATVRSRRVGRPSDLAEDEDIRVHRRTHLEESGLPTLGDRMREKYERASRRAADIVARRACGRDDREALVEVLLRERFLVPERSARRALRDIARATRSSYGRVTDAERRMRQLIQGRLEADPEFRLLRQLRHRSSGGADQVVDAGIEGALRRASVEEFLRRYRAGDSSCRGAAMVALVGSCGLFDGWVRERFQSLNAEARERLLGLTLGDDASTDPED